MQEKQNRRDWFRSFAVNSTVFGLGALAGYGIYGSSTKNKPDQNAKDTTNQNERLLASLGFGLGSTIAVHTFRRSIEHKKLVEKLKYTLGCMPAILEGETVDLIDSTQGVEVSITTKDLAEIIDNHRNEINTNAALKLPFRRHFLKFFFDHTIAGTKSFEELQKIRDLLDPGNYTLNNTIFINYYNSLVKAATAVKNAKEQDPDEQLLIDERHKHKYAVGYATDSTGEQFDFNKFEVMVFVSAGFLLYGNSHILSESQLLNISRLKPFIEENFINTKP